MFWFRHFNIYNNLNNKKKIFLIPVTLDAEFLCVDIQQFDLIPNFNFLETAIIPNSIDKEETSERPKKRIPKEVNRGHCNRCS